mgnify:CR=1 FL=1
MKIGKQIMVLNMLLQATMVLDHKLSNRDIKDSSDFTYQKEINDGQNLLKFLMAKANNDIPKTENTLLELAEEIFNRLDEHRLKRDFK